MDIVPKDDFEFHLSEQARISRQFAKPTKAKHKLLAAADEAFDMIGGVPRFALWADTNPTDFYKLYAKTLPQNIDVTGEITIRPALPPSPLDDPIDVTPERADASGTGSPLLPDGRPSDLSPQRLPHGIEGDGRYDCPPSPDRAGARISAEKPEEDSDGNVRAAEE